MGSDARSSDSVYTRRGSSENNRLPIEILRRAFQMYPRSFWNTTAKKGVEKIVFSSASWRVANFSLLTDKTSPVLRVLIFVRCFCCSSIDSKRHPREQLLQHERHSSSDELRGHAAGRTDQLTCCVHVLGGLHYLV